MKEYHYQNFDLSGLSDYPLEFLVWAVAAGILLGVLVSILYKSYTSSLLQALIQGEIYDEERAKTLGELSLRGRWYLKRALSSSDKPLRRLVRCGNEAALAPKKTGRFRKFWYEKLLGMAVPVKLPMEEARFYLPEENRIRAEIRFGTVSHPVRSMILACVVILAAAAFMAYAVPELLQMLDNFITEIRPEDSAGKIL